MKKTFKSNGARHPSVVSFSREHHFGLVFCRHMIRLIESRSKIDHIRLLFRIFWQNELKSHTESEEVFMKSLQMVPAVQQVESDHLRLEIMFNECDDYGYEELKELINLLEQHIRFEEKVLFPRVSALLSPVTVV
jgi:hypothetical protein